MSLVTVEHLRKEYPDVTPLEDVSFSIETGDVIAVVGPSGTGKSTLLRCLNRLEDATSGSIVVDGEEITSPSYDVTSVRRKMGMVFQSFNLFDNLDALGNVCAAPMKLLKTPPDEARRQGMELLERVGLADKAHSFPDELSGGQQQRVAIARAIAMRPKILLFDEPTSALDPTMVQEVLSVIRHLAQQGMTMMIVTHEMRFARSVSNRVFYMDEGTIYEQGTPDQVFDHPERGKTRQFVKHLRTLSLTIDTPAPDYASLVAQIERFGTDAEIAPMELRNILLAFEELALQCVLTHVREQREGLPIEVVVEHARDDGEVTMRVAWGGEPFDPLTQGDGLSVQILRSIARQVEHGYDAGNTVTLAL